MGSQRRSSWLVRATACTCWPLICFLLTPDLPKEAETHALSTVQSVILHCDSREGNLKLHFRAVLESFSMVQNSLQSYYSMHRIIEAKWYWHPHYTTFTRSTRWLEFRQGMHRGFRVERKFSQLWQLWNDPPPTLKSRSGHRLFCAHHFVHGQCRAYDRWKLKVLPLGASLFIINNFADHRYLMSGATQTSTEWSGPSSLHVLRLVLYHL